MNKIALVGGTVVALAGVSWAGTTWYSSQQFEPYYQQAVQQFNQNTLSPVTFKVTSFKRGFAQSRANWELSLKIDPCQPDNTLVLTGYDIIQHGVVPSLGLASIDTHIIWPDGIDEKLKKVFANQEPLEIHSKVSLLGNLTTTITSPKANLQAGLMQVDWQGLQGKIKFSDNSQQVSFDVRAPKVTITKQDTNTQLLAMSDLRYHGKQQTKPSLLPLGKAEFSIEQLQAGSTGSQFDFKNIQFERKNELNNKQIRADYNYQIGDIKLNKQPVGDFKAEVLLEHVSEQVAQQTYQALSKLQQQCNPSSQAMIEVFTPLLNSGFQIRLKDATLNAFKGSANVTATITKTATETKTSQIQPELLLKQLSASGRVQVSEQLLIGAIETISTLKGQPNTKAETSQFIQMMTQNLLQQGYLVKTSTGYQTAFALQQGQMSVNGKAVADLPIGGVLMSQSSAMSNHETYEVDEDDIMVDESDY